MADNYTTVSVPLTSGLRKELGDLAKTAANQLATADNVVYTRKGEIRGRPGEVTRDGTVQSSPTAAQGTGVIGTLSTVVSALTRAGVEAVPNIAGGYSPFALYQGRAFRKAATADIWEDQGPFWSVRKAVSEDLIQSPTTRAPVGSRLVGPPTGTGLTRGAGVYLDNSNDRVQAFASDDTALLVDTTALASLYIGSQSGRDFGVYVTATGGLNAIVEGTFPATTTVTGLVTGLVHTAVSNLAVTPVQSGFAVAMYVLAATPTQVSLARFNLTTGAVTHTTTLATAYAAGLYGGIGFDSSAAGGSVVFAIWDGTSIKSRMVAVSGAGFVDTGLQVSSVVTGGAPVLATAPTNIGVGTNNAGTAWLCADENPAWSSTTASLVIWTRSTTAATATTIRSLQGAPGIGTFNRGYLLVFQPCLYSGRMVVGVQSVNQVVLALGAYLNHQPNVTWAVLDVTDIGVNIGHYVVASSPTAAITPFANATVTNAGDLQFSVFDGRSFDAFGVDRWASVRVRLSPTGARGITIAGQTLFTGAQSYTSAGRGFSETGWVDQPPLIQAGVATVGGSLTASASYTVAAVWTYVNGAGRVVRSQPSIINGGIITTGANKTVLVTVTTPQLTNPLGFLFSSGTTPRVEIYLTRPNPAAGDDYYLYTSGTISQNATQTFTLGANDTVTSNPKLYTGGGVVPDEPPPGGDRGMALAVGRVWVADARRIYASKILNPTIAPAWSTVGFLTVEIPQARGEITALVGMDDKLLVICTGGCAVVSGPGYDDLGNGPGFNVEPVEIPGGPLGPRSVASFPQGAAYVTHDGGLALVDRSLSFTRVSRSIRGLNNDADEGNQLPATGSGYDVIYLPGEYVGTPGDGTDTHNDLLIFGGQFAGSQRVLDLETGAWATWTNSGSDGAAGDGAWKYLTAVGSQLWCQGSGAAVSSLTGAVGTDVAGTYAMTIATGTVSPGDPSQDSPNVVSGRIRGVTVSGKPAGNHTLGCVVTGAQDPGYVIMNKSTAVTVASNAKWPDTATEFRATSPRFSTCVVQLTATPATAVWAELDLEIQRLPGRAPQRNRS